MNCRGHNQRILIVQNWNINPNVHMKLLNNQHVISDAGGSKITDSYVLFKCSRKDNSSIIDTICCSPTTARDLCQLSHQTMPSFFNPLHQNGEGHGIGGNHPHQSWNQCRKQLYNIVLLLIAYFGSDKTNTPLYDIKIKLEEYTSFPPFFSYIKSVNTIIGNTKHGKFTNIINYLTENNNNLRNFPYELVLNELNNNNIEQHFE